MRFFDANVFIGSPTRSIFQSIHEASELLSSMDALGIEKALVWHSSQHDYSPVAGNAILNDKIKNSERLYGCWTILPPQTREVIDDAFFTRAKEHHIVALRAFPSLHKYFLSRQVFGRFLNDIADRRIPLLLSIEAYPGGIGWSDVYRLLDDCPKLTCVLCDVGVWPSSRYSWPLLEKHPNLYLETGQLSLGAGILEATVAEFGADRLIFGSCFPLRTPYAPMLQLLHAEISDQDKEKIASGNMERLISEVIL